MSISVTQWFLLNRSTSSRQSSAMTISLLQDSFQFSRLREQSPWLRHQRWCSRSRRRVCSLHQTQTLLSDCFLNKLISSNLMFFILSWECWYVVGHAMCHTYHNFRSLWHWRWVCAAPTTTCADLPQVKNEVWNEVWGLRFSNKLVSKPNTYFFDCLEETLLR